MDHPFFTTDAFIVYNFVKSKQSNSSEVIKEGITTLRLPFLGAIDLYQAAQALKKDIEVEKVDYVRGLEVLMKLILESNFITVEYLNANPTFLSDPTFLDYPNLSELQNFPEFLNCISLERIRYIYKIINESSFKRDKVYARLCQHVWQRYKEDLVQNFRDVRWIETTGTLTKKICKNVHIKCQEILSRYSNNTSSIDKKASETSEYYSSERYGQCLLEDAINNFELFYSHLIMNPSYLYYYPVEDILFLKTKLKEHIESLPENKYVKWKNMPETTPKNLWTSIYKVCNVRTRASTVLSRIELRLIDILKYFEHDLLSVEHIPDDVVWVICDFERIYDGLPDNLSQ